MEGEKATMEGRLADVNQETANLKQKLGAVEGENSSLKQKLGAVEGENLSLKQKLGAMDDSDLLTAQVSTLKRRLGDMDDAMEGREAAMLELRRQLTQRNESEIAREDKLSSLQSQNRTLQVGKQKLEQKLSCACGLLFLLLLFTCLSV